MGVDCTGRKPLKTDLEGGEAVRVIAKNLGRYSGKCGIVTDPNFYFTTKSGKQELRVLVQLPGEKKATPFRPRDIELESDVGLLHDATPASRREPKGRTADRTSRLTAQNYY